MTFIRYTLIILILLLCIVYGLYVYFEWGSAKEFQKDVDWLFWACVKILQDWGKWTGLGYNLLNIIIFISEELKFDQTQQAVHLRLKFF